MRGLCSLRSSRNYDIDFVLTQRCENVNDPGVVWSWYSLIKPEIPLSNKGLTHARYLVAPGLSIDY